MMSGVAVPTLTEDRVLMTWLGEGATGSGLGLGSWKGGGGLGFLRGGRGCGTPNPPSEWPQDQAPYLEDSF